MNPRLTRPFCSVECYYRWWFRNPTITKLVFPSISSRTSNHDTSRGGHGYLTVATFAMNDVTQSRVKPVWLRRKGDKCEPYILSGNLRKPQGRWVISTWTQLHNKNISWMPSDYSRSNPKNQPRLWSFLTRFLYGTIWLEEPQVKHLHNFRSPSLDQSSACKVAVKDTLMERGSVKGSQFQEPLIEFSVLVFQTQLAQGVKRCWLGDGFKHFLFLSLPGENDPIWLIFFRWVETTN